MKIDSKYQKILIENGLVALPSKGSKQPTRQQLVTILSNITYYGFALSELAYTKVRQADVSELEKWWASIELALKSVTGDDKKMADFVVYKNFPKEVLNMTEADYWFRQILMYWGFPNEYFTEEVEEREVVVEKLPVKVLQPANDGSFLNIFNSLLQSPVRWIDRQWEVVQELLDTGLEPDISNISFKENMVLLVVLLMEKGYRVVVKTATDVLRLAVGLSDGDVSLRTKSRLRQFSRPERRFLLSLLECCKNIEEDVARRRGQFKRFFFRLHPGDYKERFRNVTVVYDKLYRGAKIETFNSEIERLLAEDNPEALDLLLTRPGEFLRRLRVAVAKYGDDAVEAFYEVMPRLTVHQLVKIEKHLLTVNDRKYRTFPPRGNWTKLQVIEQLPEYRWDETSAAQLSKAIALEIRRRISEIVPAVKMSPDVVKVKLQGNDSELTSYGRGTVFDIPENITFLRSASYWKTGGNYHNTWFDNGWNFFDENWKSAGVCCWTDVQFGRGVAAGAAVFSGDPTNSKDLEGRACQMIDLYLDKLAKQGVRYAVWNILCFSHITFDQAEEVFAALQWGEKPQANKIFDPARCVFSFPIAGSSMTKYIAYVDIQERKLVYLDANLYGCVQSARNNGNTLEEKMPAFVEYLDSLPSVFDLFKGLPLSNNAMPVLYEDGEEAVQAEQAFVFMQRNKNNMFEQFDINTLLKK
jgi:hypothetical protein